jgi:uncharacterized Zn finger protein
MLKQKFNKRLSKPCPECGMLMESIENTQTDSNGVSHSENIVECSSCGYVDEQKCRKKDNRRRTIDQLFED